MIGSRSVGVNGPWWTNHMGCWKCHSFTLGQNSWTPFSVIAKMTNIDVRLTNQCESHSIHRTNPPLVANETHLSVISSCHLSQELVFLWTFWAGFFSLNATAYGVWRWSMVFHMKERTVPSISPRERVDAVARNDLWTFPKSWIDATNMNASKEISRIFNGSPGKSQLWNHWFHLEPCNASQSGKPLRGNQGNWTSTLQHESCSNFEPMRVRFSQDHCTIPNCNVHAPQTKLQERHCRFTLMIQPSMFCSCSETKMHLQITALLQSTKNHQTQTTENPQPPVMFVKCVHASLSRMHHKLCAIPDCSFHRNGCSMFSRKTWCGDAFHSFHCDRCTQSRTSVRLFLVHSFVLCSHQTFLLAWVRPKPPASTILWVSPADDHFRGWCLAPHFRLRTISWSFSNFAILQSTVQTTHAGGNGLGTNPHHALEFCDWTLSFPLPMTNAPLKVNPLVASNPFTVNQNPRRCVARTHFQKTVMMLETVIVRFCSCGRCLLNGVVCCPTPPGPPKQPPFHSMCGWIPRWTPPIQLHRHCSRASGIRHNHFHTISIVGLICPPSLWLQTSTCNLSTTWFPSAWPTQFAGNWCLPRWGQARTFFGLSNSGDQLDDTHKRRNHTRIILDQCPKWTHAQLIELFTSSGFYILFPFFTEFTTLFFSASSFCPPLCQPKVGSSFLLAFFFLIPSSFPSFPFPWQL